MSDKDSKPPSKPCPHGDELVLGPVRPEGHIPYLRHTSDHKLEAGVMLPAPEGLPKESITRLEHIAGARYAVKSGSEEGSKGPAKVATESFRNGWDNIFGHKQPVGQA